MENLHRIKEFFEEEGFAVIEGVYTHDEIALLIDIISRTNSCDQVFRKSSDLFAIRQFFKVVPESIDIIFNDRLRLIVSEVLGDSYFVVKSIYFDKPRNSNWLVPYHQDLTISVDKRIETEGFGPWSVKQNQFAVQPPVEILEDNITIRIHLDDTTEQNGALKVFPKSHKGGVVRKSIEIDKAKETEHSCCVPSGGLMLMKPLLMHSSSKTINNKPRRVIHIEFSRCKLPAGLSWSEHFEYKTCH